MCRKQDNMWSVHLDFVQGTWTPPCFAKHRPCETARMKYNDVAPTQRSQVQKRAKRCPGFRPVGMFLICNHVSRSGYHCYASLCLCKLGARRIDGRGVLSTSLFFKNNFEQEIPFVSGIYRLVTLVGSPCYWGYIQSCWQWVSTENSWFWKAGNYRRNVITIITIVIRAPWLA